MAIETAYLLKSSVCVYKKVPFQVLNYLVCLSVREWRLSGRAASQEGCVPLLEGEGVPGL